MNKPVRCTTHFHACDCREYQFEKIKRQLEIQTNRVENLKEGLRRAKEDIVFFKKYADCPYAERFICKCEFCQDRKHMQAESELSTCQAIDQELEKQLEEVK